MENLIGLALKNYRGIGDQEQKLAPFKKINIFIGANNAGKSAILNFLSGHLDIAGTGQAAKISPLEIHEGSQSFDLSVAISQDYFVQLVSAGGRNVNLKLLTELGAAIARDGGIWITTSLPGNERWQLKNWTHLSGGIQGLDWRLLWNSITGAGGGDPDVWKNQIHARILEKINPRFPRVRLIPAIRKIGAPGTTLSYGGEGLIDKLAEIQNPNYDQLKDRILFDRINSFLQEVTGNSTAQIQIPNKRDNILVNFDGKTLPISSLGTGIHEVVLIAAFCTLSHEEIVCIEEPELHLHPLLQKKLVNYLVEKTTNQYFIATHSPSFIDTEGAAIFHVWNEGGKTFISECVMRASLHALCDDLGHRASELAQSNCVIWVEGPSDRIYLRYWLSAFDPMLKEGIHYSIMFYGGRLLSHLSAHEDVVREFIDLKALNRNVAILIDSDRESEGDEINATKSRIISEFSAARNFVWITAGREIENYVDYALLQECVKSVHPKIYGGPLGASPYSHALHFSRGGDADARDVSIVSDVDKVAVAKVVTGHAANFDILDLRSKIAEMGSMIRKANGMAERR